MKIPAKIRIKPRVTYQIVWVDEFASNPDHRGECWFDARTIALCKGMNAGLTMETLLHELLHAVAHEYEFEIPHKSIYALEGALHSILKLNGLIPRGAKFKGTKD
jgi:hypothetical protein